MHQSLYRKLKVVLYSSSWLGDELSLTVVPTKLCRRTKEPFTF